MDNKSIDPSQDNSEVNSDPFGYAILSNEAASSSVDDTPEASVDDETSVLDEELAPSVDMAKVQYGASFSPEHKQKMHELLQAATPETTAENLERLMACGIEVDVNELAGKLGIDGVAKHLDILLAHGAKEKVDTLMQTAANGFKLDHFMELLGHGIQIDVVKASKYANRNREEWFFAHLDELVANGAEVSFDDIENKFCELPWGARKANFEHMLLFSLANRSPDVARQLLERQTSTAYDAVEHLNLLRAFGVEVHLEDLVSQIRHGDTLIRNLDNLCAAGVDMNSTCNSLKPSEKIANLNALISRGATIDVEELINSTKEVDTETIIENFDTLLSHGASVDYLMARLGSNAIVEHWNDFVARGVSIDIDKVMQHMSSVNIASHFGQLKEIGVSDDILIRKITPAVLSNHLNSILEAGVDINMIMHKLTPRGVAQNLSNLQDAGADIDVHRLIDQLGSRTIAENLGELCPAIDDADYIVDLLSPYDAVEYIDELLEEGIYISSEKADEWVRELPSWKIAEANCYAQLLDLGADPYLLGDKAREGRNLLNNRARKGWH